ncbi:MAG TPA: plastocyanin/azurin family copper-binding protein [Gemmatimonadales bacterium]
MARLFLLGIFLSACGGGDGGNGGTPPSSTAITKNVTGNGDAQTGTVGQPLSAPIRVLVTEDGQPSAGVTVTWSTPAAGGSLAPSSTTDNAGTATNTWTLGTVSGPQTAQASLSGATGSPVTFNATANAGAATALSKLSGASGDGQTAPINTALPLALQAKVSDEFGNGVPGVEVGWATADDATLSAPVVITDGFGTSAVQVTLGATEGPITITASSDGLSGSPQTFTATAGPPGPVTTTVTVSNNSFGPPALTVAAGTTVIWQWASTAVGHNVTPVGTEPPGSGGLSSAPDSYQHTFNTPGTYIYYCEAHGSPTTGMRGTITVQ